MRGRPATVVWLSTLLSAAFACSAATPDHGPFDKVESAEIDRLVRDVCRKEIVLLGEDASHGGGRTFEVKTEIVKRLVSRCGFDAVLFESQLYDMLDVEHAVAEKTATRAQLAGAIGALWARAEESKPLIDVLYRETMAGRVRIAGIDPQVGGVMGDYLKLRLGGALTGPLADDRRDPCRREIDTHNGWRYDEAHPFDDAAQQRLRACIDDIRAALVAQGVDPKSEIAAMAAAYSRYLEMALGGDGNWRDLGMYENIQWHRERWPAGTKLIVWCATVHAAKALDGLATDMTPMGRFVHRDYGKRAAVIGFTALSGRFGNPGAAGEPNVLQPADASALENVVLAGSDADLRYVDAKRLKRLGTIVSRPINYRKQHAAPWAEVLDGLIVLREERATERAR
ncbi:MAG: erythromycin esterase family protein [Pseudomonadota bacterium]